MQDSAKFRRILLPALLFLLLAANVMRAVSGPFFRHTAASAGRSMAPQQRPGPESNPESSRGGSGYGSTPGPRRNQEHLAQWMDRHSNLSLPDQQRALQNEPGFRDLAPQTQQRMIDRLTQLHNMTPEKRRRVIDRTEAMERLTVPQRQQVRGAMQQLGSLPQDRRRLVARAFRDLREMPEPQRRTILHSDSFLSQFSDQERNTLSDLLAVEPYLPVPPPRRGPSYGK